MSCKFDKEIIHKYVDNTIDPLELIILKEHIAVCRDCKFELELLSKLEDSMYDYFRSMPDNEILDEFSSNVLNECYDPSASHSDKQGLARALEINKKVLSNSFRYIYYLPGSKLAAKAVKKARKEINKHVKNYALNSFKKLLEGLVR